MYIGAEIPIIASGWPDKIVKIIKNTPTAKRVNVTV